MILKKNRAWLLIGSTTTWGCFQIQVFVNDDSVVLDRDSSWRDHFSVGVKLGAGEVDVVRLPAQWWKAHVDLGFRIAVDPTAFVISTFQTERIQDLTFVLIAQIHATVASTLTAGIGHERCPEFEMQRVIFKDLLGTSSHSHQTEVFQFARCPFIDVGPVEKDNRTFRG